MLLHCRLRKDSSIVIAIDQLELTVEIVELILRVAGRLNEYTKCHQTLLTRH